MSIDLLQRLKRFWRRPAPPLRPPDAAASGAVDRAAPSSSDEEYGRRMAKEVEHFIGQVNVHDLPPIFHYWSNRYLRPILESFGYAHPEDFFAVEIARQRERRGGAIRVLSLGAGNGDAEVRIAQTLRERGVDGVRIECMDINPAMLARCAELACAAGLTDVVVPRQGDFNRWTPDAPWDVVMANQSLHHVLELERLFDGVASAIGRDGVFLTSDMIGRNGHQRWPEALGAVRRFWRELPPRMRYNLQLARQEDEFLDWDCAQEGFEGIRAQDILPLLVDRFGFRTFIAWGNVVDVFIDRAFGHHHDAEDPWSRDFIDRVHAADEAGIREGRWKPTHLIAVMTNDPAEPTRHRQGLDPRFCVRWPDRAPSARLE